MFDKHGKSANSLTSPEPNLRVLDGGLAQIARGAWFLSATKNNLLEVLAYVTSETCRQKGCKDALRG